MRRSSKSNRSVQHLPPLDPEHLYYEVEQLVMDAAILMSSPGQTTRDGVIRNAVLEAFATHARVLAAFLYGGRGGADDVIADDCVRDVAQWKRARPKKPAALDTAQLRASGEIAHLTRRR